MRCSELQISSDSIIAPVFLPDDSGCWIRQGDIDIKPLAHICPLSFEMRFCWDVPDLLGNDVGMPMLYISCFLISHSTCYLQRYNKWIPRRRSSWRLEHNLYNIVFVQVTLSSPCKEHQYALRRKCRFNQSRQSDGYPSVFINMSMNCVFNRRWCGTILDRPEYNITGKHNLSATSLIMMLLYNTYHFVGKRNFSLAAVYAATGQSKPALDVS